ncbi:MAG TPA: MgtC/SapB family protein [Candidatus Acidoferrales bacterium]|nr:MgtC/SapB family protein [Candidatus Acidoferrales bacterium]
MLTLGEMLIRFGAAILLGLLIGLERESIGKEAGVRTDMLVAAGAAIFSIVGLSLPYIVAVGNLSDVVARNSGFLAVIANVVVGIGFLGAGIIVKRGVHVRGVTTAATVWFVAAVGVLCGVGLLGFAAIATGSVVVLLLILRRLNFPLLIERAEEKEKEHT